MACVDCLKAKEKVPADQKTRWCADGNVRCTNHRLAWLEAQGVYRPVPQPMPLVDRAQQRGLL